MPRIKNDLFFIGVTRGNRVPLCERFGVTSACVSESLRFVRNGLRNREIRSYAMNFMQGYLVGA